jgi:enamine deaminase RidA (YjgF/YER057c/UK114 family)
VGRRADRAFVSTTLTDINLWEDIVRAHREAFGEVAPATSMVEVTRLIDPGMLVEIEADAIVDD